MAEMLRRPQLEKLQALDEHAVNCECKAREQGGGDMHRDQSVIWPDDSLEDIDVRRNDIEALLSCPHANPIFLSETQIPGMQISALALKRPIAIAHRVIAAPDDIHFLCFSCANRAY
jgi:hypothetical protein